MLRFEDLSNELIYEIFEYLDYLHVYQAFSNLNQRFNDVVFNSHFPIKINLSLIPKSTLKHYNRDILQPNTHRIASIHCSNVFMYDCILASIPNLGEFHRLETLIFNNIESKYLEHILNEIRCLPFLSSLIISSITSVKNKNRIYRQVFRLPALKYCQLSFFGSDLGESLAMCMKNEYSSIESLVITNSVYYDQMDRLLSYVPHLRRLSLHALDQPRNEAQNIQPNLLNHITHISIKTTSLWFEHLIQLMANFFQNVQVLHLTIQGCYIAEPCIDPKRWQQLIEDHLPNLRVFDIHIDKMIKDSNEQVMIERYMNQFSMPFWLERQWFFFHQFYCKDYENRLLIYAKNPYRRKSYMLSEQVNDTTCLSNYKSNLNSIQYINIISEQSIDSCKSYFPNATQLTFSNTFFIPHSSIMTKLNRIVPLKQLTKLTIDHDHVSFRKLLKILRYAPNVHTLQLKTMTHSQKKNAFTSIIQHVDFRFVSETNIIRNFTCNNCECTLQEIQLLVALCPRIHYLTINPQTGDLEIIIRFLLDKNNPNTRYLCSLRFSDDYYFDKLNILIQSERLLDDYTLMKHGLYCYLWW